MSEIGFSTTNIGKNINTLPCLYVLWSNGNYAIETPALIRVILFYICNCQTNEHEIIILVGISTYYGICMGPT